MTKLRRHRGGVTIGVLSAIGVGLWALALPLDVRFASLPSALDSLALAAAFAAASAFPLALVLAARLPPVERFFGGLDRLRRQCVRMGGRLRHLDARPAPGPRECDRLVDRRPHARVHHRLGVGLRPGGRGRSSGAARAGALMVDRRWRVATSGALPTEALERIAAVVRRPMVTPATMIWSCLAVASARMRTS